MLYTTKEIAKCCDKQNVLDKNVKQQQQQNKKIKHKNPRRAGN